MKYFDDPKTKAWFDSPKMHEYNLALKERVGENKVCSTDDLKAVMSKKDYRRYKFELAKCLFVTLEEAIPIPLGWLIVGIVCACFGFFSMLIL